MIELFNKFLIEDEYDKILINDGIIDFFTTEILKFQYSNNEILNIIISSCDNLALGNIGQVEYLLESKIIFKIIDITNFYINDNLDDEIRNLLISSILFLAHCVNSNNDKVRKEILIYDNLSVIIIFSKSLKIDLDSFNKRNLVQSIIFAINELNVASEELELQMEEQYNYLLISNSLEEILNNYYEKKYLDKTCKDMIDDIKKFIKDIEKNIQ